MKIIAVSNFGNELLDEFLVADNIRNSEFARYIAIALNERFSGKDAERYYRAVEDDYKLYTYDPN